MGCSMRSDWQVRQQKRRKEPKIVLFRLPRIPEKLLTSLYFCKEKCLLGLNAVCLLLGEVNKGKLEHALKENEFVFHEKIPDFDTLPALKGASLVKGIGFEITDPEVSGPDIFERIVPMEAHEAASMYR